MVVVTCASSMARRARSRSRRRFADLAAGSADGGAGWHTSAIDDVRFADGDIFLARGLPFDAGLRVLVTLGRITELDASALSS